MNMPEALVADALARANQEITDLKVEIVRLTAERDYLRATWEPLVEWAKKYNSQDIINMLPKKEPDHDD